MTSKRDRGFPVMWPYNQERIRLYTLYNCPRYVPWGLLRLHEAQCMKNHLQTVNVLAERGGLDVSELAAVLDDLPWKQILVSDAVSCITRHVAVFERLEK